MMPTSSRYEPCDDLIATIIVIVIIIMSSATAVEPRLDE
jgi:hypothetical protein